MYIMFLTSFRSSSAV